MPKLSTQLTFISDPGHGWLKVPLTDIATLGIEDDISACSFIKGHYAYHSAALTTSLEEDGDCLRYLTALSNQGLPRPEIREQHVAHFNRNQARFGDAQFAPEFWDKLRR